MSYIMNEILMTGCSYSRFEFFLMNSTKHAYHEFCTLNVKTAERA